MGVLSILKKFTFYGGIAATITVPIAFDLGYERGSLDANQLWKEKPVMEKIASNTYLAHKPSTQEKYVVDFRNEKITRYDAVPLYQRKAWEEGW